MAKIPTYTSRIGLTTEPERVEIRPLKYAEERNPELEAKASFGGTLEKAGNIIATVSEKMLAIQNANAESEANILVTQEMANHTDEVNKNTDLNNALKDTPNRIQEMRKLGASKFTDPRARAEWERNFDLKAISYQIQLKKEVNNRMVDLRRANTIREMDLEASNYINAPDEQTKLASRQKIRNIMDEAVQDRAFTEEQGDDEFNKLIKESEDIITNTEKLKARDLKEAAWVAEKVRNEEEQSFLNMLNSGKDKFGMLVSRKDLISMAEKNDTIGDDFRKLLINAAITPKAVKAKTIDKDFADIISEINKGTKTPEKIRKELLNMVSDGYISETDFNTANTYFNMITEKNPDDLVTMNMRKSWRGIEVFSENTTAKEESRSRMSRSFINKLQSGVDAQMASIEAMREEVLYLHPEVIGKSDGAEYMDDSGRLKKIMPNGDVVDIQTSKKDTRAKEKK